MSYYEAEMRSKIVFGNGKIEVPYILLRKFVWNEGMSDFQDGCEVVEINDIKHLKNYIKKYDINVYNFTEISKKFKEAIKCISI